MLTYKMSQKIQCFLVCVTIIEGRHFAISNMDSVIHIRVGNQKNVTALQKATDCPYFSEFNTTLQELLDQQVVLTVIQPRKIWRSRKILGYFNLDIETIWGEPNHLFYHKWATITSAPNENKPGANGFVKLDICIVSKGGISQFPTTADDTGDDIEKNLLVPQNTSYDRSRANFIFSIYRAEGIPKYKNNIGKKTLLLDAQYQPSTYVQVTFAGHVAKTSVRKHNSNPVWNERITVTELFPTLCQRITFELKYTNNNMCFKKYIYLKSIANDGVDGYLPTFGPAYIHLYSSGNIDEDYCGKLLISINVDILDDLIWSSSCVEIKPIAVVPKLDLWTTESIFLFAGIYSATMIDKKYTDKTISFELTMGHQTEMYKENITFGMKPFMDSSEQYSHLLLNGQILVMNLVAEWPDTRQRMCNVNMIHRIYIVLQNNLDTIEKLFYVDNYKTYKDQIDNLFSNTFEALNLSCKNYLNHSKTKKEFKIKLDQEKAKYCVQEIEEIIKTITRIQQLKGRKRMFRKLNTVLMKLKDLDSFAEDCWPDVFLWMTYGNKRVAYYRMPTRQILFSNVIKERGLLCGVINNIYLKPTHSLKTKWKTHDSVEIVCKLAIQMWIGLSSNKLECQKMLPLCLDSFESFTSETIPRKLDFKDSHKFSCKIYIYEGKFSPGSDESGLSDPFVKAIVQDQVKLTRTIQKTIRPVWDQTLIFYDLILYGSLEFIENNPPLIILEAFDQDLYITMKYEFLGRCTFKPDIQLLPNVETSTKLHWHKVYTESGKNIGEILVAAVLELVTEKGTTKFVNEYIQLPKTIKPRIDTYRFDIYFWGLHDLKKIGLLSIKKPKVTVECCGRSVQSTTLQNIQKQLNFDQPYQHGDILISDEPEYYPPIGIKLYDSRGFGYYSFAGVYLANVKDYIYTPLTILDRKRLLAKPKENISEQSDSTESSEKYKEIKQTKSKHKNAGNEKSNWRAKVHMILYTTGKTKAKPATKKEKRIATDFELLDWWSKFYVSLQCIDCEDKDTPGIYDEFKIKIYQSELENQSEFNHFEDLLKTFNIYHGKRIDDEIIDAEHIVAKFKGALRIYKWSDLNEDGYVTETGNPLKNGSFQHYPTNEPISFILRVYVVRAINLRPKDYSGKSDPYIHIVMGDKVITDTENYVANSINPVFGRCYQLKGTFPFQNQITISIWDWDISTRDDLIGETIIDLEKRLYTNHRANCGLAKKYHEKFVLRRIQLMQCLLRGGPCGWRDQHKPSQILDMLCKRNQLGPPVYTNNSVKIGPCVFSSEHLEDVKQQKEVCSLIALHHWAEIPIVGCTLVPEHVETRSLYHPFKPGLEQGKLQLWLDIFPCGELPVPNPVDITRRKPVPYELRVTIWNTDNVILDEDDFFLGERKSDIYVKGWLESPEQSQCTDVHYNSVSGEGNFNWRFIFTFLYSSTENRIITYKKQSVFSADATEHKLPCQLTLQVWDNDVFNPDDFIGSLTLDISKLPRGAKNSKRCKLNILESSAATVNLFKTKRHRGWWPFRGRTENTNKFILSGKVEAELQLLTEEESSASPAGIGRSEPQKLPDPKRPDISFAWFRNPLKALKYLICKRLRGKIICILLIAIFVCMLLIGLYAFPNYLVKKMLGA